MPITLRGLSRRHRALILGSLFTAFTAGAHTVAAQQLHVVATLPTYASIAQEVAGDRADVQSIARGDQDPHFVTPRPSFAAMIRRADLFITTGLDLELWVPGLLDRANNSRVVEGAPGNVVVFSGVTLLDVPDAVSRAAGDVHIYGNPHLITDPVNGIIVAKNIEAGLERVDPAGATVYQANLARFQERVLRRLFGDQLVEMLGQETLLNLARTHQFWDFAKAQSFQGHPLVDYLGGWLEQAAPFRDRRMVCYHKNWAYFSERFRAECAIYIEPKPGIPPAPGHVRDVIEFIEREHISVLFAANYFSRRQVEGVANRAGIRSVIVPEHVHGSDEASDYFTLVDLWVKDLADAFTAADRGHP